MQTTEIAWTGMSSNPIYAVHAAKRSSRPRRKGKRDG
jgi:hypothetical protein